jgi:hypothetical protein
MCSSLPRGFVPAAAAINTVMGDPEMDERTTMAGSPVDLSSARYVEIKITKDRVYVNTEHGMMFRAYRVERIIVQDERDAIEGA